MSKCIRCEFEQRYPLDDDLCGECRRSEYSKKVGSNKVDTPTPVLGLDNQNNNTRNEPGDIWEKVNNGEKITLNEMVIIQRLEPIDDKQVKCPQAGCDGTLVQKESRRGYENYVGCDSSKCNYYLTIKQLRSLMGGTMHPQCPHCKCEIKLPKIQNEQI